MLKQFFILLTTNDGKGRLSSRCVGEGLLRAHTEQALTEAMTEINEYF